TVGPDSLIDAPFAGTPFTVSKSLFVSNSHTTVPSFTVYARSAPSFDPAKRISGNAVMAAESAALHPRPLPHLGEVGGENQTRCPLSRSTACNPPGCACWPTVSDTAKYARVLSTA